LFLTPAKDHQRLQDWRPHYVVKKTYAIVGDSVLRNLDGGASGAGWRRIRTRRRGSDRRFCNSGSNISGSNIAIGTANRKHRSAADRGNSAASYG